MTKLKNLIKNLTKANKRLKEAVDLKPTRINKDATIQRFEFCFELAWKTIQAYTRDQGLECKSPKNCFRVGAELELIKNPKVWFGYTDGVYSQAIKFPSKIDGLLSRIKGQKER